MILRTLSRLVGARPRALTNELWLGVCDPGHDLARSRGHLHCKGGMVLPTVPCSSLFFHADRYMDNGRECCCSVRTN